MSGSQHAYGYNDSIKDNTYWKKECKTGWWNSFIGPNKALDTNKFFIICVNFLGGCYGSTGPNSINPQTGTYYAGNFPKIRAIDIVKSQMLLLEHLKIEELHAVIGGSVGGLVALTFAALNPDKVKIVIPIASSIHINALQKLLLLEQISAIENDPNFQNGFYYDKLDKPNRGIALARMISHKTFISLETMEKRASKELRHVEKHFSWYNIHDPLESYMLYQGNKFVSRFDANSYLRILSMWSNYNLSEETGCDSLNSLFSKCKNQRYLIFSIDSDVCFYPDQQSVLVEKLKDGGIMPMHITVHSEKGHDSFLLEQDLFTPHLTFVLERGL